MTGNTPANDHDPVRDKIKIAERETGLSIAWIRTGPDLKDALNKGLYELYAASFSKPPYEETFTFGEVEEIFRELLQEDGDLFVAYNDSGKPLAFYASSALSLAFLKASGLDHFEKLKNAGWHAEEGVDEAYRQHGLSTVLRGLALAVDEARKRDAVLLRTNTHNYPQIHSFAKKARYIADIFQEAASLRKDGTIKTDVRSFYVIDLQDNAPPQDMLGHVTIAHAGDTDTALVWDDIPATQQAALAARIQKTYPGIGHVMFVEKKTDGGFRGRMPGPACAEAVLSLAYVVTDGKSGDVTLEISGQPEPVTVEIKDGKASFSDGTAGSSSSPVSVLFDGRMRLMDEYRPQARPG